MIHRGRRVVEAGHSEGSYQESASSSAPGNRTKQKIQVKFWPSSMGFKCSLRSFKVIIREPLSKTVSITIIKANISKKFQINVIDLVQTVISRKWQNSVKWTAYPFKNDAALSPRSAHCSFGSPGHRTGHFALCWASTATGKTSRCALGFLRKNKQTDLLPLFILFMPVQLTCSS